MLTDQYSFHCAQQSPVQVNFEFVEFNEVLLLCEVRLAKCATVPVLRLESGLVLEAFRVTRIVGVMSSVTTVRVPGGFGIPPVCRERVACCVPFPATLLYELLVEDGEAPELDNPNPDAI